MIDMDASILKSMWPMPMIDSDAHSSQLMQPTPGNQHIHTHFTTNADKA
jgi:hypothetical protein